MMRLEHYEKTDVGKKRSENQDSFGVSDTENFFVVCDGMGGGAAGDFASQFAVDTILKSFRILGPKDVKSVLGEVAVSDAQEALKPLAAIRLANRALKNYSDKFPRLAGMGTTVAAVLFDKRKGIAHIYNVGDSRVYRVRNGRIEQLTKDHTKVSELVEAGKMLQEEVKNAEIQSMLTRALGTQMLVRVDYRAEYIKANDCYIICSDGINGELEDSTIRDISYINKDSAESLAKELVYAANNAGGRDNSTVVVVNVDCSGYLKMPVIDEKLEQVLTVEEETLEQSYIEDRILKKILTKVKVKVPDKAKDKNFLKNPVYIGTIFAVLFLGLLERVAAGRTRLLVALPLLSILWTNLHGGFVAGLILAASFVVVLLSHGYLQRLARSRHAVVAALAGADDALVAERRRQPRESAAFVGCPWKTGERWTWRSRPSFASLWPAGSGARSAYLQRSLRHATQRLLCCS